MELVITSTDKTTTIDGVPVRLWQGVTPGGVTCLVFVHRVVVHKSEDHAAFAKEFFKLLPPGIFTPLGELLKEDHEGRKKGRKKK